MRVRLLMVLIAVLAAGCYPSLHPIWTPETLVYYPDLLGTYQDDSPATAKNTTTLERGDAEKSYRVVHCNGQGEKTGEAVMRLVKLGDSLFYDYLPVGAKLDAVEPPLKEFHLFGRLTTDGGKLQLYGFDGDVDLNKALRWRTVWPAPTTAPADLPDAEPVQVVSSTTAELQDFLKANAKRMNVKGGSWTRLPER